MVMVSSTLVYGAHPRNPNFLTESAELRGHRDSRFINDKVRAEILVLGKEEVGRVGRDGSGQSQQAQEHPGEEEAPRDAGTGSGDWCAWCAPPTSTTTLSGR